MATSRKQSLPGFLNPTGLLIAGLVLLGAGLLLNQYNGLKGEIKLQSGQKSYIKTGSGAGAVSDTVVSDLGLTITLDSLKMTAFTPLFEIKLSKKDTVKTPSEYQPNPTYVDIGLYPLEQMKIRGIEKSDFRFRLKEFYPNFQFAYQYPSRRDTIEPRAPGITLELKTKEGSPIVTLRSDQPNKHLLGDIVSLGASLAFYWYMPMDSIKAIAAKNSTGGNKIIFSGSDSTIYSILKDSVTTQPLRENEFYNLPSHDSTGFTILFCYPDVALLKAVPSTKGSEMNNPVAHVEIWKEGGSAIDAFLYPETRGRKGGDFEIPTTDYKLGLSVNKEEARKHCDCTISVQKDSSKKAETLTLVSGQPVMSHGYKFSPVECKDGFPGVVIMEVSYLPGRIPIIISCILIGIAMFVYFLSRIQADPGQNA